MIKAVKVSTRGDVKVASEFSGAADLVLYDAKPPQGSVQQGGHGQSFDWSILSGAPTPKIWGLAGGLTPDNVARAVAVTKTPIVDVSSGVERAPGLKDETLIKLFMRHAKGL